MAMEFRGAFGSRKKFEWRMKKLSPEFSFDYFVSKAFSIIQTSVYAKDEQELQFYRGEPLDPEFKNILDLNNNGTMLIDKIKEEGQYIYVTVRAIINVLHADGDNIKYEEKRIRAVLKRRNDIPINTNFSMTKIQCPSCGPALMRFSIRIVLIADAPMI